MASAVLYFLLIAASYPLQTSRSSITDICKEAKEYEYECTYFSEDCFCYVTVFWNSGKEGQWGTTTCYKIQKSDGSPIKYGKKGNSLALQEKCLNPL